MHFSSIVNLIIIISSATLVWVSGTKLAIYADWIACRYKIGKAFVGSLLLALVTSSPELATVITASWIGNAPLAISNLLGGINLQTFIIAIADLFLVKGAITYFAPKSSLLIGGIFVILQLAVTIIIFSYGEIFSIWNIGLWPLCLFVIYLLMLYFIFSHEKDKKWAPVNIKTKIKVKFSVPDKDKFSNYRLLILFCLNALIVFMAGCAIAFFADKLAIQWNWSGTWMGVTLVALTTSLPEVSTTLGAVKQKAYVLALANIFGSNALTISLLFPADIFYRKGPILNEASSADFFLAGLAIIFTSIFLWGILERRNKTLLRMGIDSLIVFVTYLSSLFLLYKISK